MVVNPGPQVSEGSTHERLPGIKEEAEVLMKHTPFFKGVKGGEGSSCLLMRLLLITVIERPHDRNIWCLR